MIKNRNKAIVEGAFLASFCFLFSMVNVITGGFFDILFIYFITLLLYQYRKKYDNLMSIVVFLSSVFVVFLSGQIFFLLFLVFTVPVGIILGQHVENDYTKKKKEVSIVIICLFKNTILFQFLSKFLGTESIIDATLLYLDIDLFFIYLVGFLVVFFMSALEGKVLIQYAKLMDIYISKKK